jgi:hypothetical protein
MADGSDDHATSDEDDGVSQEETPFEGVLPEMLGIMADHEKKMRGCSEIREVVILGLLIPRGSSKSGGPGYCHWIPRRLHLS